MTPAAARTRWWQAAFGLACAAHLYALYWPEPEGAGTPIPYADKVAHVLLFGTVAYLGIRIGLPARWVIGVLVVEAAVSEIVQHYLLPLRSGDPFDAVADIAGVALGAWLALQRARSPAAPHGPSTSRADTP